MTHVVEYTLLAIVMLYHAILSTNQEFAMTIIAIFLTFFFASILVVAFIMSWIATWRKNTRVNTTADYTDDTALFNEPTLEILDVLVATNKGQVPLSSAVNIQADSDHALELARNLHTVEDVPMLSTH